MRRAAAIVARTCPEFRLEIAGDGAERFALEQLAASLQLENHVKFLGEIHDIPSLLCRASLFVLPSRTEGISLTILEAMASGLPVVATSVGGNPEVVVHERTGILVPAGDPEALASNLMWIARHPRDGEAMGRAGRERVEACFDCRRMVAQYERLYLGDAHVSPVSENAIVGPEASR
jgi:glycosyltransferase involved in cell wall biosynthesis